MFPICRFDLSYTPKMMTDNEKSATMVHSKYTDVVIVIMFISINCLSYIYLIRNQLHITISYIAK